MSDRKEPTVATPVASPAATGPAPIDSAPETTASTTVPAADTVTAIPETSPPQYEQNPRDVIAPAPAVTSNTADYNTLGPVPEKIAPAAVTPNIIPLNQLGEAPGYVNCPFCFHNAMTRVDKTSTSSTSMAAVCCCLFGGIICAFLPYCMEMCHDCHHFCGNCNNKIAIFPDEGTVQVFTPANPAPGQGQGPVHTAPAPVEPPQAQPVMKN
ncbi:uncharacterized protein N7446_000844 [Penicillium canescens]|uniref:LITAF domain-containing protein n=1 Tax=Penicillium canescens TaxID=5083 RepID=A0AAD6I4V8_PENCN|nr:uncharacterized protein N7446_000844 [Penicillium canescens]KAJ6030093.1 hypothetical protein N7460_010359 [Penicillium canescens]KAJ6060470.1 hypothetical protein N7444_002324 [Penicillium canescens]KAJ6077908.1 hypothetical protein N7446_000844 [Penicillium canescens]